MTDSKLGAIFKRLGNAFPPLAGIVILALVQIDGKPLCNFKDAVSKGIPWIIIFLIGSTMVLSSALTSEEIGITVWLKDALGRFVQDMTPFVFSLFVVGAAVILTNFSSNTVTASLVTSIAVPVSLLIPDLVNPYATTAVIGSAVNFAFATPLSTAVVAIVAGSHWVNTKNLTKHGSILGIISILLFIFIGYPLANLLIPYA